MGRITEKVSKFLIRIANRLGIKKDNLLESAKEDLKAMGPVVRAVPTPEVEEVKEMSDRDKFAKELQDQATRFDPSTMSQEEAIMKILEQQGLNSEFSKNPVAVKQISKICNENLKRYGIEGITSNNLDEAKNAMTARLTITENGDLIYNREQHKFANVDIENTDFPNNTFYKKESKSFSIENNMLKVTDNNNEKLSWNDGNDEQQMTRTIKTYDKNGLQMKETRMSDTYDLKTGKSIRSQTYTLERNSDLITAKLTVKKVGDMLHPDGSHVSYDSYGSVSKNVYLEKNGIEEIYCTTPINLDYDDIVKANLEHKPVENEVAYYSEVDEPEKYKEQKEYHAKLVKDSASRSVAFRKTAEEKGLIEKEEALEQE